MKVFEVIKERYLKWRYPLMPKQGTVVRLMLSRVEFALELSKQCGVISEYVVDDTGEQHSLGFYNLEGKRVKFRKGMFANVVISGKKRSWVKIFDNVILVDNIYLK